MMSMAVIRGCRGYHRMHAPSVPANPGRVSRNIPEDRSPDCLNVRRQLSSIATPSLIVAGEHDFLRGPRWARELHDAIGGSQLTTLDRCGHMAHLEDPEAFSRTVAEFGLARTSP
jgi:proline iminopeptidase